MIAVAIHKSVAVQLKNEYRRKQAKELMSQGDVMQPILAKFLED